MVRSLGPCLFRFVSERIHDLSDIKKETEIVR